MTFVSALSAPKLAIVFPRSRAFRVTRARITRARPLERCGSPPTAGTALCQSSISNRLRRFEYKLVSPALTNSDDKYFVEQDQLYVFCGSTPKSAQAEGLLPAVLISHLPTHKSVCFRLMKKALTQSKPNSRSLRKRTYLLSIKTSPVTTSRR